MSLEVTLFLHSLRLLRLVSCQYCAKKLARKNISEVTYVV